MTTRTENCRLTKQKDVIFHRERCQSATILRGKVVGS
ncbi:unnamed protein product [Musa acuminata subsp. malaccensis]|uniref:(wild Malaysian banana) hypothetical protein n=1 Tax=Musa acuminata subsp. malaccensis TaxID=214687 RepID=A0A8D7F629_MUSAM|nr:unnamed protein product [Musa acuminata subsp. malaccensis]